jgi:hypothetical protein
MHDRRYVRQVRALLEASTAAARAAALDGHPLDWLQDSVSLDAVRRVTPAWRDSTLDEDWRETVRALLDRSWRGVRGQG